jgi:carbonic anhydrase/acetyltransferase-like protein (isoleucine patch superfamily)
MNLIPYKGIEPKVDNTVFIADGVRIIGNVQIKKDSSIWYNAVLRGDIAKIEIGEMTNIQDNASVHVESTVPTIIGNGVTIGHNAIIHGCTIEDNVMIGMGAIILNGAHISKNCLIGAGAIITENKLIPENSLVIGMPGKVVRALSEEEIEQIRLSAIHYSEVANNLKKEIK